MGKESQLETSSTELFYVSQNASWGKFHGVPVLRCGLFCECLGQSHNLLGPHLYIVDICLCLSLLNQKAIENHNL